MLKVKQYTDKFLDPSKASYVDNLTVNEALKFLNIAEVDYYDAFSLSPISDCKIHLRRPPNSCFINNYNPIMLKVWKIIWIYYKAVSYMSAYFSKSESETSQALLQACSKIRSMNLHARDVMHKLEVSNQVQDKFLFKKQYITVFQNFG